MQPAFAERFLINKIMIPSLLYFRHFTPKAICVSSRLKALPQRQGDILKLDLFSVKKFFLDR